MYPANDTSLVNQLGEILGADLDTVFSLNNLDGEWLTSFVPSRQPLQHVPLSFLNVAYSGILLPRVYHMPPGSPNVKEPHPAVVSPRN